MALSSIGTLRVYFEHDGAPTGSHELVADSGAQFNSRWCPYGDDRDLVVSNTPGAAYAPSQGPGKGYVEVSLLCTKMKFKNANLKGEVPDFSELEQLTDLSEAFDGNDKLTGTVDSARWPKVQLASAMFRGCVNIQGSPELKHCTELIDATEMFKGCEGITGKVDLGALTNVTAAVGMFCDCSHLESVANCNALSQVIDLSHTFENCTDLDCQIDISQLVNLDLFDFTFSNCINLKKAPILPATLDALRGADATFNGCRNLTETPVFANMPKLSRCKSLFKNCELMPQVPDLSMFSQSTNIEGMFDNCGNLHGTLDLTQLSPRGSVKYFLRGTEFHDPVVLDFSNFRSPRYAQEMCKGAKGDIEVRNISAMHNCYNFSSIFQGSDAKVNVDEISGWSQARNISQAFQQCYGAASGSQINLSPLTHLQTALAAFSKYAGIRSLDTVDFTGGDNPSCTSWENTIISLPMSNADLDSFLIAIDTSGPDHGTLAYAGMPSAQHFDNRRSPAALQAINSLIAKGWVRAGTY